MMEIKTPIEWNDFAEDFLDADGNIFRADQIATALNLATDREKRLVEALEIGIDSLRRIKSGTYEEWAEGRADKAMRRLERLLAKHKGENGTSTN